MNNGGESGGADGCDVLTGKTGKVGGIGRAAEMKNASTFGVRRSTDGSVGAVLRSRVADGKNGRFSPILSLLINGGEITAAFGRPTAANGSKSRNAPQLFGESREK